MGVNVLLLIAKYYLSVKYSNDIKFVCGHISSTALPK